MYIHVAYDQDFDDLMMHLRSKYPKQLFDMDGIGEQLDLSKFSKKFFSSSVTADSSIDANANVDDTSVIAYSIELPKPFFKINSYYVVWKNLKRLYGHEVANSIIEMQLTGEIYIHDFHGIGAGIPYCANYSTYDIVISGLPMIKKIRSIAPKYLYSFKSQIEQFTIIAANSTLGATGLADFLLVTSYYMKNILKNKADGHFKFASEEDCWIYLQETLVSFIYTVNQPLRGNQSCFTNISIYDRVFIKELQDKYIFPDDSRLDVDLCIRIQELFLYIMNAELRRTPVTFPIVTACFAVDKENNILDEEFLSTIAEYNQEFGFINIYCGASSTLSSCCRLRSDSSTEYFNSFGSGGTKIGSLGVVSINFPRLAINCKKDKEEFFKKLAYMVNICAMINNVKRHITKKRIENGNLPLYTYGFMSLDRQYSTVGVNGLNECVELMGLDVLKEEGQQFVIETMNVINTENNKFEKKYNAPHNCEQVPGENMSIKMAAIDKLLKYQDTYDIYSNQFIPLTTRADLLDRMYLQGLFDKYFSGGAICHLNVDQKIEDSLSIANLIKTAAKQGVVYFAINYNIQECQKGHMAVGKKDSCAICNSPIVNNFTRVVGFLTNVKNWHKIRREQDYPNRQFYGSI